MSDFFGEPGTCGVPLWYGYGGPAGLCGNTAYGTYIDGPSFWNASAGSITRNDHKYHGGHHSGLACPNHSGPEKVGPRVFVDGTDGKGLDMYCAVYEDFENLQESPAEFHVKPWVAIKSLETNHPRALTSGSQERSDEDTHKA